MRVTFLHLHVAQKQETWVGVVKLLRSVGSVGSSESWGILKAGGLGEATALGIRACSLPLETNAALVFARWNRYTNGFVHFACKL